MQLLSRFLVSLVVPAFVLAGLVATPAFAQDKAKDAKAAPMAKAEKGKSTTKIVLDNDKVRVFERTYKPGDVNDEVPSANYRVNYTIKGGTLERTYADGKKEKVEVKAGMTRYLEPAKGPGGKYTNKNIGNTDIVSYVVLLK
jgi:hypothetical protein